MVTRRRKPNTTGKGKFFRIELRPKEEFKAGSYIRGSWDIISWLVSKEDAHVEGEKLVITNTKVKKALAEGTRGKITHVKADIFRAYPSY